MDYLITHCNVSNESLNCATKFQEKLREKKVITFEKEKKILTTTLLHVRVRNTMSIVGRVVHHQVDDHTSDKATRLQIKTSHWKNQITNRGENGLDVFWIDLPRLRPVTSRACCLCFRVLTSTSIFALNQVSYFSYEE